MTRLMVVTSALAVLAGFWSVGPATAGPIDYSLNLISSSSIGSGALGTVALTQNGTKEVDVSVTLSAGTAFVSTGGPHNAFVFNLNATKQYTVTITSPSDGSFVLARHNLSNTPYGQFSYAIDCSSCGSGASNPNPGPLDFKVTALQGISAADFVANANGIYFSADVRGPAGGTGNIAANGVTTGLSLSGTSAAVPEPGSLPLLGAGVVALGCVFRRRTRHSDPAGA